jgi:predicted nucleic acid-binding protein
VATIYVDTSALVKRYVAEAGSAWVRRMVARPVQHVMYTAALTEVEVRSALYRLVREHRLDAAQAQRLTQRVIRMSW